MKVAILHYRLGYQGGLEARVMNYCRWFAAQGHDVTVVCARQKGEFPLPQGVRIKRFKVGFFPHAIRQLAYALLAAKWVERHHFDYVLSMARNLNQTAVLGPGNHIGYMRQMGLSTKSLHDRTQIWLDRQAFNRSKIIFPASDTIKNEIAADYGIDPQKMATLFPPTDDARFNLSARKHREVIRAELGIKPGQVVFLGIGRSERKGFPMLKRIFDSLPSSRYILWLAGADKAEDTDNIISLGFRKDIENLMAASDALVLPSPYEPYGAVVQESLMCGTPVLISDQVGAKSWITPQLGQVLPVHDFEAWQEAIDDFDPSAYSIPINVGEANGCTLDSHMERMLSELRQRGLIPSE